MYDIVNSRPMTTLKFLPLLTLSLLVGCGDEEECCSIPENYSNLQGSWQLYEYGYSPSQGYIVEEIPNDPAQVLTFNENRTFSSNAESFSEFGFFELKTDSMSSVPKSYYVLLYTFPNDEDKDAKARYTIRFLDNGDLQLIYRFCIEGCHYGLKRVN